MRPTWAFSPSFRAESSQSHKPDTEASLLLGRACLGPLTLPRGGCAPAGSVPQSFRLSPITWREGRVKERRQVGRREDFFFLFPLYESGQKAGMVFPSMGTSGHPGLGEWVKAYKTLPCGCFAYSSVLYTVG